MEMYMEFVDLKMLSIVPLSGKLNSGKVSNKVFVEIFSNLSNDRKLALY